MNSLNKTARLAGLLYLIIAILGPIGILYIPSQLVVPGDAAATAGKIVASETLFRISIASDSIVVLAETVLVVLLYVLFRQVSGTVSLAAAFSRLGMAVVQGVNLLNYGFILALVGGAGYLAVFQPNEANALIMLFLDGHQYGVYVWQLFFGLHCLLLGYLVYKSGYFPRILGIVLGVLLVFNAIGYMGNSYVNILVPGNQTVSMAASIFLGLGSLGELAFALWLLIKGVNEPRPANEKAI